VKTFTAEIKHRDCLNVLADLGRLKGMTFYERSLIRVKKYVCQAAMKFVPIKTRFAGIGRTFFTNNTFEQEKS